MPDEIRTDEQPALTGPTADDIDNAGTPPEPAPAKRSRRAAADVPTDPHAGHAVYDETLTRYVSEVYRGTSGESDANAKAKQLRKSAKGHTITVRPV